VALSRGHGPGPAGCRGRVLRWGLPPRRWRSSGVNGWTLDSGFGKDGREKLGLCCAVVTRDSQGLRGRGLSFRAVPGLQLVSERPEHQRCVLAWPLVSAAVAVTQPGSGSALLVSSAADSVLLCPVPVLPSGAWDLQKQKAAPRLQPALPLSVAIPRPERCRASLGNGE